MPVLEEYFDSPWLPCLLMFLVFIIDLCEYIVIETRCVYQNVTRKNVTCLLDPLNIFFKYRSETKGIERTSLIII